MTDNGRDQHSRHTIQKAPVREDWLQQRAPFMGASDVAALFGEHPFRQLGDIAVEKIERIEQPEKPAMTRGRMLENAVAQWWAVEHGCEVEQSSALYLVDDVLIVTPDFDIPSQPDAVLEVKTCAHHVDRPERYWYWQVQAQMVAMDRQRAHIACLDASMQLKSFTVERDYAAGEAIIDACALFIEQLRDGTLDFTKLPISYDSVQQLYPVATQRRVELDNSDGWITGLIGELHSVQARIKSLQSIEGTLKGMLTVRFDGATDAYLGDELIATWRPVVRNDIDTKRLRADLPHIAATYERSSTSRRLLLK